MATTPTTLIQQARQSEIALALGVMFILGLLFVPIPSVLLDFMFTVNIALAVMILLTVMFIQKALEFTAFPMLLLITTMLRLSLNVASTRLILTEGHSTPEAAGKIIEAFGEVVVGGNPIVGLIVFLILVIVNFIVITKGAGRIAEVAARFTLDSLPGKQMAIDADLNAGLIDEDQARARRSELESETGFFGAMDGASKFVRGDAIAGLIITGLNIVVGMTVGVMSHGMTAAEAANRFMLLTVGDGLVAQIPALIISTAAGMLVAKSGTIESAGQVISTQIGKNHKALFVTAGLLGFLSLLPNMPVLPFWFLAGLTGAMGYAAMASKQQETTKALQEEARAKEEELAAQAENTEEPIASILHVDTLKLELGYGLLGLIDEARGGRLTEQIKAMRRQMAKEIGFVTPSIRIQDNMQSDPGAYKVLIKDIKAGEGILRPNMLMAMDPTGHAPPIEGEDTVEPTFGLAAKWIEEGRKDEATFNGYTVVDTATVIVTHLTEVIKDNLAELLTRTELEKLLEETKVEHAKLINDLIPEKLSIGTLQQVLKNLLAERISIRDLPSILEAAADFGSSKDIPGLTEYVRSRLGRQICAQHLDDTGTLPVLSLSSGWEKEFAESILEHGEERRLAMEPNKVQSFITAMKEAAEAQMMSGVQPVVLTSPTIRPFVHALMARALPQMATLSQSEIHPKAKLKTVGVV